MASLDALINSLETVANSLPKTVAVILKSEEKKIVQVLQNRLMNEGTDGNDNLIGGGVYADMTIRHKLFTNQEAGHFTLFDQGNFHKSMRIDLVGDKALIAAQDPNGLMFRYGEAILGLQEDEEQQVVELWVDPVLEDIINERLPNVITL